ncbi:MAG: hypothetical protein IT286_02900 [Proteobacteria bacterium]|nr:hypothetical protein [Pseudomonadota bacterium]
MIKKFWVLSFLISGSVWAGECGENCFEKNLDASPEKETIRLDITKPGTIEIKIVGKTSIPVTTTADLDDIYTLSVTDRDNDGDFDFSINWIEDKTKMDKTMIFQNDGKGNFKDVTAGEK